MIIGVQNEGAAKIGKGLECNETLEVTTIFDQG